MKEQFCPYCYQLLKEVDGVLVCPIHGVIEDDRESETKMPDYVK